MRTKKRAKQVGFFGKLLAMLPVSCVLLYPIYLAAQLDTVYETYASPELPEAFDGLKIAFVSDIHSGSLFKEKRVRDLVKRVNDLGADIILLGGDYGEDSAGAMDFFELRPAFQAKIAVLATVGNHDRTLPESNFPKLLRLIKRENIIPAVNDAWMLKKDGKTLAFASTDDFYNGIPSLRKVERLCRNADFTVFFPHSPDLLPLTYTLSEKSFFQLAVCGHTHGGQVSILGHAIKSSSDYGDRFLSGWYRENGADILVSNGVGTSGLPVRLGARPQIHLITLKMSETDHSTVARRISKGSN